MLHNAGRTTPTGAWTMKHLLTLCCFLLLASTAQAKDPRCMSQYDAEAERIQREAMARAPAPGSDQATQRQFMQGIHTQLKAAADRAEACEAASRPKPGSPAAQAAAARAQQCTDTANREIDQARASMQAQGRPTMEQQRAYREAEDRILDARADCLRRAR